MGVQHLEWKKETDWKRAAFLVERLDYRKQGWVKHGAGGQAGAGLEHKTLGHYDVLDP